MKTGARLKDDVIGELRWDPQIADPEAVGVGAGDGAVIVSGHVPGYAGRMAAPGGGGLGARWRQRGEPSGDCPLVPGGQTPAGDMPSRGKGPR